MATAAPTHTTGGLKQAGDILAEGGQEMRVGARFLEDAGKMAIDIGAQMTSRGNFVLVRFGEELDIGARHALDNKLPIGMGWFRIANAGQVLCRYSELRNAGKTELFQAGQLISKAGHMITQGGEHLTQAGIEIREAVLKMEDEAQTAVNANPNERALIGNLSFVGNSIAKAGKKIASGGRKIVQVMKILNNYGTVTVDKGRLHQRGQDIVLIGEPTTMNVKIAQGIVRWGGALWQRIHPRRLGVNPPLISQQYQRPQRLPGVPKYDWLDNGLNDANNLDEYMISGYLGSGSYGIVNLAHRKDDPNFKVAIKKVNIKSLMKYQDGYMMQREKRAGRALKHHNICNLLSCFNQGDTAFFIFEYCDNGNLNSHVRRENGFTEEMTRFYSGELIMALRYMASLGWVHRDIKAENILLDRNFHLKLSDFGLAKHEFDDSGCCIEARGAKHMHRIATSCGTPIYRAPETFQARFYPTNPISDIWSLGCVIYNMVTNRPPLDYYYRQKESIAAEVISGNIPKLMVGLDGVTNPDLVDLQTRLRDHKLSSRLGYKGFDEIIGHSFYTPIKSYMLYDTLYDQNPPPFKTPPPSSPDIRSTNSTAVPKIQQDVRAQSIAGIRQTPRHYKAARARNLSDPSPNVKGPPGGKSSILRPLTTANRSTALPRLQSQDGPIPPDTSFDFDLPSGPHIRHADSGATITPASATLISPRGEEESVRLTLAKHQPRAEPTAPVYIDMDPDAKLHYDNPDLKRVARFFYRSDDGLDLDEPLIDDVFSPQSVDATLTPDRSDLVLQNPGAVKFKIGGSDSSGSTTSPRANSPSPGAVKFKIGGSDSSDSSNPSPVKFKIGGSDSSGSTTSPRARSPRAISPRGTSPTSTPLGIPRARVWHQGTTVFLRQRPPGRRPPSFDDPPRAKSDSSEEFRLEPTYVSDWQVDRHSTASPPPRPRQDDDDDEFYPDTVRHPCSGGCSEQNA